MSDTAKKILKIAGAVALIGATFGIGAALVGGLTLGEALALPAIAGLSLGTVAAVGLSAISATRKPALPDLSQSFGAELQLSGEATAPRKIIYGEAWTAGVLRYRHATGTDNKDLYLVIVLAGHEIESVEEVMFDDETLTLDGSGDVTAPDHLVGLANVRYYLGTDSQTADATLATFDDWSTEHRLRGLAYAIVQLTFNEEKLAQIPQIRFRVRGRKVYDPRLDSTNGGTGSHRLLDASTWEWSRNVALCANDYMRGVLVNSKCIAGMLVDSDRFDWANVIAEANVCDEEVDLSDANTELRYTCDGVIDPRQTHGQILRHFEIAMAGDITFSDGKWRYFAGAYRTPTITLTDAHFIGPLNHTVHVGESQRYDTAQGVYASSDADGGVVDYAPVSLSTATVGEEKTLQIDMQLVNDVTGVSGTDHDGGARAQRIAKLLLEREAAGKQIQCTTNLYGLLAVPGETINVTHAAFGLSSQAMRVMDVQLRFAQDGDKAGVVVDLTLQAGASSLYAWDAEETVIGAPATIPQAIVPFQLIGEVLLDDPFFSKREELWDGTGEQGGFYWRDESTTGATASIDLTGGSKDDIGALTLSTDGTASAEARVQSLATNRHLVNAGEQVSIVARLRRTSSAAVTWGAAGTTDTGTNSCAPSYPTGISASTSRLYAIITGHSIFSNNVTPPVGWRHLGRLEGGTGTYGADTGERVIEVLKKITVSGSESGTATFSYGSSDATDTCCGTIFRVEIPEGYDLDEDLIFGEDSSNGTSFSATASASTDWLGEDLLIVGVAQNIDTGTQSSQSISASGVTFGTRSNRESVAVTDGNDHRHIIDSVPVSLANGGSAAPTYAYTISASGSGAVAFLRLRATLDDETRLSIGVGIGDGSGPIAAPTLTATSVSNVTISGISKTVTTSSAHGLYEGQPITISGVVATGDYDVNGEWLAEAVTSTTFALRFKGDTATGSYTSGGTVTSQYNGFTLLVDDIRALPHNEWTDLQFSVVLAEGVGDQLGTSEDKFALDVALVSDDAIEIEIDSIIPARASSATQVGQVLNPKTPSEGGVSVVSYKYGSGHVSRYGTNTTPGTTDMTTAAQDAHSASLNPYYPPETIKITDSIPIRSGQHITCDGTVFSIAGSIEVFVADGVSDWSIDGDWSVVGDNGDDGATSGTGAAVKIIDSERWRVRGLTAKNIKGYGIRVQPGSSTSTRSEHGQIVAPQCYGCYRGIELEAGTGAEYVSVIAPNIKGCNIGFVGAAGNHVVTGGSITDNTDNVKIGNGSNHAHGIFSGVDLNHATQYLVHCDNVINGETFIGCHLYANDAAGAGAIFLEECKGVQFVGGDMDCWIYNYSGTNSGTNIIRNMYCPGSYGLLRAAGTNNGHDELLLLDCFGPGSFASTGDALDANGVSMNDAAPVHVLAHRAAASTQSLTSGSAADLLFDTEDQDRRGAFNAATGVFTVPDEMGGVYRVTASLVFSGSSMDVDASSVEIKVNGTAKRLYNPTINSTSRLTFTIADEIYLNDADAVKLTGTITGTNPKHGDTTYESSLSVLKLT